MILFFLGVCMCITFFVLQTYITTGFHAREHRLLPLVLALVALYNFYRIVQAIMGHSRVFEALIDLLVIQMVYALFHYVMDFMHFKIKAWVEALLFFSLLLSDFMMFYDMVHDNVYQNTFLVSLLGYVLLTLGFSTYARILTPLSQIEGHVNDMLYASIALPGFAFSCIFKECGGYCHADRIRVHLPDHLLSDDDGTTCKRNDRHAGGLLQYIGYRLLSV